MNKRIEQYSLLHQAKLETIEAMWRDPKVQMYDDSTIPAKAAMGNVRSVFLAGPTSRNQVLDCNWRCEAVALLRAFGYEGWIYVPEPRGQEESGDFTEKSLIHKWEHSRLMSAMCVAFWIPRKAPELLGLNTNLELGIFLGKVMANGLAEQQLVVGWPEHAERMGLPEHYAVSAGVQVYRSLPELCEAIANNN